MCLHYQNFLPGTMSNQMQLHTLYISWEIVMFDSTERMDVTCSHLYHYKHSLISMLFYRVMNIEQNECKDKSSHQHLRKASFLPHTNSHYLYFYLKVFLFLHQKKSKNLFYTNSLSIILSASSINWSSKSLSSPEFQTFSKTQLMFI